MDICLQCAGQLVSQVKASLLPSFQTKPYACIWAIMLVTFQFSSWSSMWNCLHFCSPVYLLAYIIKYIPIQLSTFLPMFLPAFLPINYIYIQTYKNGFVVLIVKLLKFNKRKLQTFLWNTSKDWLSPSFMFFHTYLQRLVSADKCLFTETPCFIDY